jgi:DNA-binding response OmpR family regulator
MEDRKRILIVDDEQLNLDFFDLMLSRLGFIVEKADSGQAALDIVRKFNPELIILDNIMPKLSGWEVTKILKSNPEYAEYSGIPIIMFSAMDDVKDKIEGFELGIEDYITKPYNFSEVLARIRTVLKKQALINQLEKREARIKLSEDLKDYLDGFVASVEDPLKRVREASLAVKSGKTDSADRLVGDCDIALEKIAELKNTIETYRLAEGVIKKSEIGLKALEKKFQKEFQQKAATP